MKKAWIWILGAVVVVGGGLYVMYRKGFGVKPTTAPASAAVVPQPSPNNRTAQNIAAATGLVSAVVGGLKGLDFSF